MERRDDQPQHKDDHKPLGQHQQEKAMKIKSTATEGYVPFYCLKKGDVFFLKPWPGHYYMKVEDGSSGIGHHVAVNLSEDSLPEMSRHEFSECKKVNAELVVQQ